MSELILSGTLHCLEGLTILRLRTSLNAEYLAAVDELLHLRLKKMARLGQLKVAMTTV